MPREFTEADLEELKERLATGHPAAIKQAVQACKPKQSARVPPVPSDPRLTRLKRATTMLLSTVSEIREGRAYCDQLRTTQGIAALNRDMRARTFYDVKLPTLQMRLFNEAETLASRCRSYFSGVADANETA